MNKVTFFIVINIFIVTGCNEGKNQQEQRKLASQIVDSMVTVDGGRYQMGVFGILVE